MIKVHVLPCGSTKVDEALPFGCRSRNPLAYTGILRSQKHKISVPVTAYLIEHPKGLVLVDTGWDTAIRDNTRQYEGFANYFASPGFLPEGEAVTEHLGRLGYQPSDLDYVIMTHMDIDHAGGIGLVKDAKHIMCSEAEWQTAGGHHVRYLKRLWKDIYVETFPDSDYDLLGDGTVMLLPMHGHSAGMTAVKVGKNADYLIIAGDAGYGRPSWEELILPGVEWNKKEALASLKRLQAFGKDPCCQAILMTHDTDLKQRLFQITEG